MTESFPLDCPVELKATGSWPASVHLFDQDSVDAIEAAMAARRPLLVRGEPGTGKSQLARAAAQQLGRLFVSEVVHARSESQDLQWHFDAVARLGEAQAMSASKCTPDEVREQLDPLRFLTPGALWWVFDWQSASSQAKGCPHLRRRKPIAAEGWTPEKGSVLLIDEIDKADADLPNGLLETLGNGSFTVPYLDHPIGMDIEKVPPPLVVITTNEERELPAAFVRRCFVLYLRLPKEKDDALNCLDQRGQAHFGDACSPEVRAKVGELLWTDREAAARLGTAPPGQAEYLDILRVLATRFPKDYAKQLDRIERIGKFALKKYTGLMER